jgi:uncharacterized integral membrane protein (TIGR00698 family)
METKAMSTAVATAEGAPRCIGKSVLGVCARQSPILLPGFALAVATALLANWIAGGLGGLVLRAQGLDPVGRASPISGIAVAVVVGLVIANVVKLSPLFAPGLDFAMKKVLRAGIILVGIKLSIVDVARIGGLGVPVVAAIVTFGLAATLLLARAARVSNRLGSLAAASTAICGITATVAVAPAIGAKDQEVAYTVANVTLFGLVAMIVYPYLAHWLFADQPGAAGLFLGTSIHETSQVMGAAISYKEVFGDERAAQIATVAKLTRNALLVGVVPILAWLHARSRRAEGGATSRLSLAKLFPMFVLGFIAVSLVRSAGDFTLAQGGAAYGLFDASTWSGLVKSVGEGTAGLLLGSALAAVGLTTTLSVFKGLGVRPLLIGLAAAALVGVASLALAFTVGPLLG